MKKLFVMMFFATLGAAQVAEQAATKIAEAAQPTAELMTTTVDCLERASKILKPKQAAEFCLKGMNSEVKRGNKAANEAADATKNNHPKPRPLVIAPSYGGYYGGGYRQYMGGGGVVYDTGAHLRR